MNTIPSFTVDTYGHLTQADEVLDLDSFYTRSTDLVPKSGGTFTGDVTVAGGGGLILNGQASSPLIRFQEGGANRWQIPYNGSNNHLYIYNYTQARKEVILHDAGGVEFADDITVNGNTVLHTGNYGTEIGYQTLSFNGTNNELTITDGNTVTLSLQVTSSSQLDPDVVTGSKIESNTIDPGNINNTGTFTGSFTNGDGNTVNVTNGLITSIMI